MACSDHEIEIHQPGKLKDILNLSLNVIKNLIYFFGFRHSHKGFLYDYDLIFPSPRNI